VEVKIYPDTGRGFTDPDDAVHFRPADSEDVARRTQQFFASHLKS
jgi:dienelactone hydrolase